MADTDSETDRDLSEEAEAEVARGKGTLTARDKEWLIDGVPEETKANTARQYRRTVRRRLKNAIQDFRIFAEHLPASEVEQVFDELDGFEDRIKEEGTRDAVDTDTRLFFQGARGALTILYEGLGRETFRELAEAAASDVEAGRRDPANGDAKEQVLKLGPTVDIDIHVPEHVNVYELVEKFDTDGPVAFTNAEVGVIVDLLQDTGAGMPSSGEEFARLYLETKHPDWDTDLGDPRDYLYRVRPPVKETVDDVDHDEE